MVRVTAAIIIKEGKFLIAQRRATDRLANMWEFPGGKIENGETPEECLKREIKEELGISIIVNQYIGSSVYHYDHISIELMAYHAEWISGEIQSVSHKQLAFINRTEVRNYSFAPADIPFVEMISRGEINV